MMKRTLLFIVGLFFVGTVAMQAQTLHDPNANPTITPADIQKLSLNHDASNRDVIVLDFEGLGNSDNVNGFYDGGTSSQGYSGTNYGIGFSPSALALIDSDVGGTGNFANEPSPETIMFFLTGLPIMNVPAGFEDGFSFYYCSSVAGSVTVYDGVDGTGAVLTVLDFPATGINQVGGDPTGDFDLWLPVGVAFDGIAKSVVFSGVENQTGFDDITFGSETPGGGEETPLSDWALFIAIGLILMFAIFRVWRIARA
jgi:hypothetical protein